MNAERTISAARDPCCIPVRNTTTCSGRATRPRRTVRSTHECAWLSRMRTGIMPCAPNPLHLTSVALSDCRPRLAPTTSCSSARGPTWWIGMPAATIHVFPTIPGPPERVAGIRRTVASTSQTGGAATATRPTNASRAVPRALRIARRAISTSSVTHYRLRFRPSTRVARRSLQSARQELDPIAISCGPAQIPIRGLNTYWSPASLQICLLATCRESSSSRSPSVPSNEHPIACQCGPCIGIAEISPCCSDMRRPTLSGSTESPRSPRRRRGDGSS